MQKFRHDAADLIFAQDSTPPLEVKILYLEEDCRLFVGQTLNGHPHGLGLKLSEAGFPESVPGHETGWPMSKPNCYLGNFREGKTDGWGLKCSYQGEQEFFLGSFVDGLRCGWGKCGLRTEVVSTDFGKMRSCSDCVVQRRIGVAQCNDEQYRGEWDSDSRHGFGVCIHKSKNTAYVGFWRYGAMHGRGLWMTAEPSSPQIVVRENIFATASENLAVT